MFDAPHEERGLETDAVRMEVQKMAPTRNQIAAMTAGLALDELACRLAGGERKVVFPALSAASLDETSSTEELVAAGCDVGYRIPRAEAVRMLHIGAANDANADAIFAPSRRYDHALELAEWMAAAGLAVNVAKGSVSVGDEGMPSGRQPLPLAITLLGVLAMLKRQRFATLGAPVRRIDAVAEAAWCQALESAGPIAHWVKRAETAPGAVVTIGEFTVHAERSVAPADAAGRLAVVVRAPDRYNNSPAMWAAIERATARAFAGHAIRARINEPARIALVFDVPVRESGRPSPVLRAA
jgi:hypothetical protein